jgi:prevent-host-death family protein
MKRFTLTELQRAQGDVIDAATKAPVALTKRGKERFVVMSAEHYEALNRRSVDPRIAFTWNELPDDIAASLLSSVEAWIDDNDHPQAS